MHMVRDQLEQPLLVVPRHVTRHVDPALVGKITAVVMQLFENVVFFRNRLELHHRHVAALGKVAILIEDIGDTTRHAGCKVAPGLAENDDETTGHVFTAMIADTFDDRDGARIAHSKALTGNATEIALAFHCAVENGVADDDRFFRDDPRVG